MPDVDVVPSEHFNTVLYTGTGTGQSITGVGFEPSLVWTKSRSSAKWNMLYDAVRGGGYYLGSNATQGDATDNTVTFDTDGYTCSSGTESCDSGDSFVAWNWKANGSGSSNTDGDITSTVSANVDAGFSIVSYSGATNATVDSSNNSGNYWTIGHGLSEAPELIIAKNRGSGGWYVGSDSLGSTPWTSGSHLVLNSTAATANNANMLWGNAAPNSSTFKVGGWDVINRNGNTYIAYCFHSVDGYSKVGSYTGNGSTDGTFIYTSFAASFILFKRTNSSSEAWRIYHNKVEPYNPNKQVLSPNSSGAEGGANNEVDFVSNGFKIRTSWDGMNNSGENYIYIAFASVPFKFSNAR